MSSAAMWSLYDERLGPEWANRSLSRSTFVTEDVFEAVAHLVPAALKARFLGANEDERVCCKRSSKVQTISPQSTQFLVS